MHWFFLTFFKMITTIHQTFVVYTVTNTKHMRDLVTHHRHRTIFYSIVVHLVFLHLKESIVITSKRKNTSSLTNTRQTKHKVPLLTRIQISHTHTNHTKSIRRQLRLQMCQNITSIQLRFLGVLVDSGLNLR